MNKAAEPVGSLFAIERRAPAKINLALHVTGRRGDGYHSIDTIVAFTEYGDRLLFSEAAQDRLSIDGPFASALSDDGPTPNLVERARDALRHASKEAGGLTRPVAIELVKKLPAASGMGGGSSDAAATLSALCTLWPDHGVSDGQIEALSLALGADVPMCRYATTLRATGIGEEISPLSGLPRLDLVLINPAIPMATPAAFKALGKPDNAPLPDQLPDISKIDGLLDWLTFATRNDLQPAAIALVPEISQCLAILRENGAALARMSGSGATCFGIYKDAKTAANAASNIRDMQPDWFCVATRTSA